MFKQYKRTLLLTSLVLLIPMIAGLLLWDKLPDQIPIHWNIHGEVDNWGGKGFAVFGIAGLMLAMQWLCFFSSMADPKYKNYSPKMFKVVLWICPVIALFLYLLVYAAALGYPVPIETVMPLLVGAMFIIIGNWLPKMRQTYTMGIKLPWTFASEENWNATHRFSGKVWVIGGLVTMVTAFFGNFWILLIVLMAMVVLPTLYSYLYYRRHGKEDSHDR